MEGKVMPQKTKEIEKTVVVKKDNTDSVESTSSNSKKPRKPYPSYEERIAAADKKIMQLTKLNAARIERISQMESKLATARSALAKSQAALESTRVKREHLITLLNRPVKEPAPRLSDEERKAQRREALSKAREVRREKRAQMDALVEALKKSGKTVEDLLETLES